jgi:hypothetical protein
VQAWVAWALRNETELQHRTAWALDLRHRVETLENEVEERTFWALRLKSELMDQTSRAQRSENELYRLIHNPLHLVARLLRGIQNRLFNLVN